MFQLYFFHVPARTDILNTTIAPAPQLPTGKTNEEKNERAPEVPGGDVKGDTPKFVGSNKTLDTSVKDNRIINDKAVETKKTSDEQSDNNVVEKKVKTSTKAIDKNQPNYTKQPENPAGTNIDSSKTDTGFQPGQNEIPNKNIDGNEGVRKRAVKVQERLVRKHSRNIWQRK